jgi:hypothetical protein
MNDRMWWTACRFDPDGVERQLQCPKCSCPKLIFKKDVSENTDARMYLGKRAACVECGHEFTVTENCWETVCECD